MRNDKDDLCFMDVEEQVIKCKNALGFIADRIEDPQASAAVSMIEEAMEQVACMIRFLLQPGPEEIEKAS